MKFKGLSNKVISGFKLISYILFPTSKIFFNELNLSSPLFSFIKVMKGFLNISEKIVAWKESVITPLLYSKILINLIFLF